MKTVLAVALILFTTFMAYVVVGGFIQKQQKEESLRSPTSTASQSSPSPASVSTNAYTVDEVANHNTPKDCWLIINDKVYSVGSFLAEHPGGVYTITPYCGKEATKAFDTQDRGSRGGHSSRASAMLADYLVGSIK